MISDHRYYYPRLNIAAFLALSIGLSVAASAVGIGIAKIAVLL